MPSDDLFQAVDAVLESKSPADALDLLANEFRQTGRYDLLFEVRTMRKRLDLGLPLIQVEPSSSFPEDVRPEYEQSVISAAREAGELYLAAGNIPAGYRYLRAIAETDAVAAAIENATPGEDLENVIAVAFQEGVHPLKGLELILRHQGMCRAITAFGMHAVEKDREACIALLVRELYNEVLENMRRAIERREGAAPETGSLAEIMAGRDWLFSEYDYYVDTSHLTSVIPYCMDVAGHETLCLIGELCEYGKRLSPNFAFQAAPPFDDGYVDYGHYVMAVLRQDEDDHIRHFRDEAARADDDGAGSAPAQVLVALLARLERFDEALDVFLEHLADENPAYLRCPNALQLCNSAGNYGRMRELAHARGDALSYAAASVMLLSRAPRR